LNFDFNNLGHTRSDLENFFRLAQANSASLFPAVLPTILVATVEVLPLASAHVRILLGPLGAVSNLLLELVRVLFGPFTPFSHLALELLHHPVQRGTTSFTMASTTATTTATTATTTSSAASATEVLHQLVNELHRISRGIFALLFFGHWIVLTKHSDHNIRGTTILPDFEEGMIVTETFFARSTIVKVLADRALVAQALDWANTTTIASDIGMDNSCLLGSLFHSG